MRAPTKIDLVFENLIHRRKTGVIRVLRYGKAICRRMTNFLDVGRQRRKFRQTKNLDTSDASGDFGRQIGH